MKAKLKPFKLYTEDCIFSQKMKEFEQLYQASLCRKQAQYDEDMASDEDLVTRSKKENMKELKSSIHQFMGQGKERFRVKDKKELVSNYINKAILQGKVGDRM